MHDPTAVPTAAPHEDVVLAVDIGGTKITAARVAVEGDGLHPGAGARVLDMLTIPTPAAEGAPAVLDAAVALSQGVLDGTAPVAVGIASAGVIDTRTGIVTHATGSLTGWPGTDLAGTFTARLDASTKVLNDVHAHALGEARFGVGQDAGSMLLVAVGTGIGGGHVIDGLPVVGAHGAAGHIGHLGVPEAEGTPCPCGRSGHLEGLASGPGILALAERLGARDEDGQPLTDGHRLAEAARTGNREAALAYRTAGLATGRAIGGLLNTLDVEVVALTGGVAEVGGQWRDALADGVTETAMDVVAATPVLPAAAGVDAALLGAAAWAVTD